MIRVIAISLLCLFSSLAYSQDIFTIEADEMNIKFVDEILDKYDANESDSPLKDLKKAIHIAEELNYHNGVTRGYERLSALHENNSHYPLQLRSLLLYSKYLENHELNEPLKENYYLIGNIYYQFDLLKKALISYHKSDSIPKDFAVDEEIKLQKQIALTHSKLKNYNEANVTLNEVIETGKANSKWNTVLWAHQQKSKIAHTINKFDQELKINKDIVALTKELNLEKEQTVAINNLAYTYKYLGQYEEAETYFTSILSGMDTPTDAVIYQNLAILDQNNKRFKKAKLHFEKALFIYSENNNHYNEAYLLDFLALTYYQQADFHNALRYNEESIKLSKKHLIGDVYQSSYYTQSLINQGLFEYEDALASMNRHLEIKDSLESIKNRKQNEIELQQMFLDRTEEEVHLHFVSEEMKDLEIKRLQAERAANDERMKRFEADLKRFEADSLLNQQKLITQQLKIKEFENLLAIQEQENQIRMLDEQRAKQELALQLEKMETQKKEESLLLEKKNNEVLALQLKERQAYVRSLIYYLLGLLAIIVLIIIFYLNVRKKKKKIDQQRILIQAEKEKSESLLLNILPITVAEELKEKGKSPPRHFDMISIIFTDFSGFTKISEKLTPVQLVEKLDDIFLEFDLIVERNGLNRIKTIGDAYMCAAGLPDHDPSHAENAVKTALEMRDYVEKFNASLPEGEPKWNIRIGVNSGPVVAGVVGIRKFAYDIWGDAVNVASRMESSGEISKVNISDSTYQIVKGKFQTSYRGKVYAKNKGEIDMYFIEDESNT